MGIQRIVVRGKIPVPVPTRLRRQHNLELKTWDF